MTTTLDLVRAISLGDSTDVNRIFTDIMDQKINDAIEARTETVRSQMFGTTTTEE